MIEFKYVSAFILGLMSSGHCLAMCGGISGAFGLTTSSQSNLQRSSRLFAYNSGRIVCYSFLGFVVGYLGQIFAEQFIALMKPMRIFSGLMLMAMACYVGRWWMGITVLERAGQKVWNAVRPISLKLTPLNSLSSSFLFGSLWGLLPCGLVYSMLVWVSATASATSAALLMMCFGIGTLPAMLGAGYGAGQLRKFLQHRTLQNISAVVLLLFGIWTIAIVFRHSH